MPLQSGEQDVLDMMAVQEILVRKESELQATVQAQRKSTRGVHAPAQ